MTKYIGTLNGIYQAKLCLHYAQLRYLCMIFTLLTTITRKDGSQLKVGTALYVCLQSPQASNECNNIPGYIMLYVDLSFITLEAI